MEAVCYFLQKGGKVLPVNPASHLRTQWHSTALDLPFVCLVLVVGCRLHSGWFLVLLAFLGAFVKLRNATVSFVMYVRPEQLCSHWTDFYEILYLRIFRKICRGHKVSLKYGNNNGYFIWRRMFVYISLSSS